MQNGFVNLPLGTDNAYVPINDADIGSMISFVLASNIYKDALVKVNYMDSSKHIKNNTKSKSNLPNETHMN